MEPRTKGIIFAFLVPLCSAVWAIFGTKGFSYYNVMTTIVLWFGFASLASMVWIIASGKTREFRKFPGYAKWLLLGVFFNSVSVISSFYALKLLGPSLNGFLGILTTVFIVLSGVFFLHERFNRYERYAALLIIPGIMMISYQGWETVIVGLLLIIIGSICISCNRVIIKDKLNSVEPILLVNYRATGVFLIALLISIFSGMFEFHYDGIFYVTLPAVFSAVLSHYFVYKAYKTLEISKVEMFVVLQPFIVLAASYLIFHESLSLLQLSGGLTIIAGVFLMLYGHKQAAMLKRSHAVVEDINS